MRSFLNPITRKRLNRFKEMKRAYWSFWLLLSLYCLGLGANFLCNNLPLYLRYEGKYYFPIVFYYPEDAFLENGRLTRPDYKQLANSEVLREGSDNKIHFPLFPYGPNESVSRDSIEIPEVVTVEIERAQRVGTVNVRPDYAISRSDGSAYFFGLDQESALRDQLLKHFWVVPPEIEAAVAGRFLNKAMPSVTGEAESVNGSRAVLSLSPFEPRSRSPRTIRITFREIITSLKPVELAFDTGLGPITEEPREWLSLTGEQRTGLLQKVETRFVEAVPPETVEIKGLQYSISFNKDDLYFPFRPTPGHAMGLDGSGRDVLVRIIYALRTSLNFGFLLVTSTMILGILFGALQGYFGGKVDLVGQRLIEIWESLPFIYILILIGSVYGRSFVILLIIYGFFNWIGISYYMRAEFLRLRRQPFVESALCMGLSTYKIIFRHILPNGLVPIITFFPFSLVGAIGVLAALDFLGFGLPPPTPSWGELLSQAQEFRYAWWLVLYPSLALFIVVLLGVFIGEGVRSAFDPRTNSRLE